MSAPLRVFEVQHEEYLLLGADRADRREIGRVARARIDGLLDSDAEMAIDYDRNPRLHDRDKVITRLSDEGMKPIIIGDQLEAGVVSKVQCRFEFRLRATSEIE